MNEDVTDVAPTEEVEVDPAVSMEMPATEETPAEAEQETSDQTEETPEETSDEPSQVEPEESANEPAEEVDWSKYVLPLNQPLPVDEDGQVDPNQYKEQLKQEMRFEQAEIRAWQDIEKKYPDVRTDPELREDILARRLYDVQKGGTGTLQSAADRIFSRTTVARNKGKADQQTSIRVQKSSALAKPTGTGGNSPTNQDMTTRIHRGDQSAIHETLSQWIKDGKA